MDGERHGHDTVVHVSDFLEAGRKTLGLELIAGKAGLDRRISEGAVNRPGLALSGFYSYFAHRRIQVFGLAEYSYLSTLNAEDRAPRLREFFSKHIPCVVMARGKRISPEMLELSDEFQVPLISSRMITKYFINAATLIMENLMAPHMNIQGTMVEIMGVGVLIDGRAGIGKSETALGLIKRGHALISDDVTGLRRDSEGAIIGFPIDVIRYHMEIRGLGIIHVPSLFGVASIREEKRLDFVVSLFDAGTRWDEDRGGGMRQTRELLGVKIPQLLIPVGPGRDIVNVLETAAMDYRLKRLGHDASKELDQKIIGLLSGRKGKQSE